jgi:ABC-type phosphate transport system ATPase subunit
MSSDPGVKVSVQNLSFYYGKYQALKNISLPLHRKRSPPSSDLPVV